MPNTLIIVLLHTLFWIAVYFLVSMVLSARYLRLANLLKIKHPELITPMEAMIRYFPLHYRKVKAVKKFIELEAASTENENIVFAYRKVKSVRNLANVIVVLILSSMVVFISMFIRLSYA